MAARLGYKVYKISRTLNILAHVLLLDMFSCSVDIATCVFVSCHCAAHI
jgi:hypothetical protein